MGVLHPEILFSRKWGFGPLSGVGETQIAINDSLRHAQHPLNMIVKALPSFQNHYTQ